MIGNPDDFFERLQYTINIVVDVGVEKADDADVERFDVALSFKIVRLRSVAKMGIAVEFNRQPEFGTVKVDDVRTDSVLAPKLQMTELFLSQIPPQPSFGWG